MYQNDSNIVNFTEIVLRTEKKERASDYIKNLQYYINRNEFKIDALKDFL